MLPVGHTHEDVDAIMKGLSVYLKGHNAHSFEDYVNAIKCMLPFHFNNYYATNFISRVQVLSRMHITCQQSTR